MSQKGQSQIGTDLHRENITLQEAFMQKRMIQAALHITVIQLQACQHSQKSHKSTTEVTQKYNMTSGKHQKSSPLQNLSSYEVSK